MPTTIESLELQVQQNATSAVGGIDALSASLSRLKNAVKGGVGLNSVANQVRNLDTALKSVDGSSADNINRLADSLSKLKGLGNIKLSSSIGNQLKNISSAAFALNSADLSGLGKLSAALQPLNNIGKASGLKSAITQLQKLPQLAQTLNGINWATLTSQLQQLSNSLAPLANQLNTVSNAFGRLPTNIRRVVTATNTLPAANNRAATSYVNLWAKFTMAIQAVRTGARVIASWITESNSYIENLNLFNASMGKYTEEARRYAEQVGELMGIDPGEFMRNQGIFMTITEGFGVASDRAYIMSKNLTQLGYDLSSFFNISFADAMQKLESGISGELEPLRGLGYDLSQARLQQEAWNLGIERNITDMTQAEKAQLRYYAIMTQVTTAQGDMARTLNAPANQLRILQSQVVQAARALGNIFIPILNAVLPYAIALAKVIRILANTIASFFGFKLPEIDYSGVSAGASAVGDLADNAGDAGKGLGNAAKGAKKLKNALLGIDELNIISPNDSSSLGSGGGAGGLVATVGSNWNSMTNEVRKTVTNILLIVGVAALAIGAILAFTGAGTALGVGLMLAGAASIGTAVALNWDSLVNKLKGVTTKILAIAGAASLAIGLILVCTGVGIPLGIGLILAGAASLGTAVAINWDTIKTKVGGALIGVADKFGEFKDWVGEKLDKTKETIQTWASNTKEWFTKGKDGKGIVDHFKDTAKNIIDGFKNGISDKYETCEEKTTTWAEKIKSWFTDYCSSNSFYNIASDVVNGFSNGIGSLYRTCKNTITSWGSSIISWFKDKLDINSPSRVFARIATDTVVGYNNNIKSVGKTTKSVINDWANSFTTVKPVMSFAVDTSALKYYSASSFSKNISTEVSAYGNYDVSGFKKDMKEFFQEYLQPYLSEMAEDIKRQADKEEKTVVTVGARSITQAVDKQRKANGYNFSGGGN